MNAPTDLPKPRDAYLPAVLMHFPTATGEEAQCRAAIMLYRDVAQRAICDHWLTGDVAEMIYLTALKAALAPASIDELKAIGRALRHMTRAFGELESACADG